jgi:hypothetical protein
VPSTIVCLDGRHLVHFLRPQSWFKGSCWIDPRAFQSQLCVQTSSILVIIVSFPFPSAQVSMRPWCPPWCNTSSCQLRPLRSKQGTWVGYAQIKINPGQAVVVTDAQKVKPVKNSFPRPAERRQTMHHVVKPSLQIRGCQFDATNTAIFPHCSLRALAARQFASPVEAEAFVTQHQRWVYRAPSLHGISLSPARNVSCQSSRH